MKNTYRLGILLLLSITLGFVSEQNQAYDGPTLESMQLETIYSEHGVIKFKMSTNKALHYENGDKTYPEVVYIEYYEPEQSESDQSISVTARANSAYYFAQENVYEFRGNVVINSIREKKQLTTEKLCWSSETETFFTDKFIRIEAGDEILTGEGLTVKQDLSHYSIEKPQGIFKVIKPKAGT